MVQMSATDVRGAINDRPMSPFQIAVVALCVIINMLDGFDVLVMSFAASSVSEQWQLSPADLGLLFSSGLVGMAIGSVWMAPYGDRVGRRLLVLGCLAIVTVGMLCSSQAADKHQLAAFRFVTGLGIGGMLATLNTMVSEYSSAARRGLCISVLQSAYPLGAILGGIVSVYLLGEFGWRSLFLFGGLASLCMLPLAYWKLPESLDFLLSKDRDGTLVEINRLTEKMRLPRVDRIDPASDDAPSAGLKVLLEDPYRRSSALIWSAFFCLMFGFYYVVSWTPKLLVDAGLTTAQGISAGIYLQLGGIVGALSLGLLTARYPVARLTPLYLLMSVVSMLVFGFADLALPSLMLCAAVMGFCLIGAMIGLYTIAPSLYPVSHRVTGMGWAIGIGRLGAIVSPLIGGMLLVWGFSAGQSMLVFALPLLLAALATFNIHSEAPPNP